MKNILILCAICMLLGSACQPSVARLASSTATISSPKSTESSTTASSTGPPVSPQLSGSSYTDPLNGIVVNRDDWLYVPGKYTCGRYTLTKPDFTEDTAKDVFLEPGGILIAHPASDSPYEYDVTFGKDCQHVYYEEVSPEAVTRLQVVDVHTGTTSSLSIPDTVYPNALVMHLGDRTYYPTLSVLYAIDANDLLLWFENPTTGLDAYTNQSSQAVFNLTTQKLTFVSLGGGSPPVLLNYKTDTLIVPGDENAEGVVTSRVETNLQTGQQRRIVLTKPYEYTTPCDQNEFDDMASYLNCRNEWLAPFLN